MHMNKPTQNLLFSVNSMLLVCSIAAAFSGLTIMIRYHMGHSGMINVTDEFWGFDYSVWSGIHKTVTIALTLLMAYHVLLHWKWYKNVVLKKLMTKNKQVILLSFIFICTCLTGFIPWILPSGEDTELTRRGLLEIHDKMGIVLIVLLVLHVRKRFNWFMKHLQQADR